MSGASPYSAAIAPIVIIIGSPSRCGRRTPGRRTS